jgi:hypothetical protein
VLALHVLADGRLGQKKARWLAGFEDFQSVEESPGMKGNQYENSV